MRLELARNLLDSAREFSRAATPRGAAVPAVRADPIRRNSRRTTVKSELGRPVDRTANPV